MLWLADIYYEYAYLHMDKYDRRTSNIISIAKKLGMEVDEFRELIRPFNPHYTNDSMTWDIVVGFKEKDVSNVQKLLDGLNVMVKLLEV